MQVTGSILSPQLVHMPSWSCPWGTRHLTGFALRINLLLVPEAEFPQERTVIKSSASAYMSTSLCIPRSSQCLCFPLSPTLIYGLIVISPLCRFPPPGSVEQAAVLSVAFFPFQPTLHVGWTIPQPFAVSCEEGPRQWHASAADHCPQHPILMTLCFSQQGCS